MGTMINIPHGKGSIAAYLAEPRGGPLFPALLVLHEWVGLDDHIRDVADRLAGEGYLALAPDLYEGKRASDDAEAERLMNAYGGDAPARIRAAYAALKGREDVQTIGCIGMSMGGTLALGLAVGQPDLRACAVFYGPPEEFLGKLGAVRCSIAGFYAERDEWVPLEQVRRLDGELHEAGVAHRVEIYPGAQHDFFNDRGPTYKADAAQDAWRRTLLFFAEHLR